MHRIVHLDLKGAPLKVVYLEKLIQTIKSWGVTGILLEWEDTFPYSSDLVEIGSLSNSGGDNMYSLAEVLHILQFIKDNGLVPIQLIQTIGHMEFVLKHPTFSDLQEINRSPAVLCPSKPQSQMLVREMINQALEVQPDAQFFHIGADEVWHAGICADCQSKALTSKYKTASLYLDHIKHLVLYIKEKRPDITILMWDDMLRTMDLETLKDYALGDLVVPVLWNYNPAEGFSITQALMNLYGQVFPKLWFGTAFKGANGSCQVLSPVDRYVSNHQAWVNHIKNNCEHNKFYGVILTGWSRYDHYSTLCELLPVALPSLASCMKVLTRAEGLHTDTDNALNQILPSVEWPGERLARCVHSFVIVRERCLALLNSDHVNTWLNPWQILRKYTVPGHVEGIAIAAEHLLSELTVLRADMTVFLQEITGERSTDEWLKTYLEPMITKISKLSEIARERSIAGASVKPLLV